MITAPYNFVPLSRKVFFPDWAGKVSHDVPFSDGISGELTCELTTHTPIYIRNGGDWTREDIRDKKEAQSFFCVKHEGKETFMIPGTSLKGVIRSVVEIASFGKMGRVDDHRYSVRDLTNRPLYLTRMAGAKAGWLVRDDEGRWRLSHCEFARVDHNDLIKLNPDVRAIKEEQLAKEKYERWKRPLDVMFDLGVKKPSGTRAANLGAGALTGTLVFTGQPTKNNGRKGEKHLEFIFYQRSAESFPVDRQLIKDFEFIHSNSNLEPNDDLKFHNKTGCVPVFYHGSPSAPKSFGLALMYRLPYKHSIKGAISHTSSDHFHPEPDLAETIFGFADDTMGMLKGRVSISPAVIDPATAKQLSPITTILNGPKPTYYPNYLEQPNPQGAYTTLMDDGSEVRGWKRYPVRLKDAVHVPPVGAGQQNVSTQFIPLEGGARFRFSVKVHNLRPVELGALAWSLTWGAEGKLRHAIGMGKALGYGQASISVAGAKLAGVDGGVCDWKQAMTVFEEQMNREVGGAWRQTVQLEQLLAMANPEIKPLCGELRHMGLAPNEFVAGKKEHEVLLPHIRVTGRSDSSRFGGLKPRAAAGSGAKSASAEPGISLPPATILSETIVWPLATLVWSVNNGTLTATQGQSKAELRLGADKSIVPESLHKKLFVKKEPVKANVTVEKQGNMFIITKVEAP